MFLANVMDEKLNIQKKRTIKIREHFFEAIVILASSIFHNEIDTCLFIYIIQNRLFGFLSKHFFSLI
jgi:hypothetical protein